MQSGDVPDSTFGKNGQTYERHIHFYHARVKPPFESTNSRLVSQMIPRDLIHNILSSTEEMFDAEDVPCVPAQLAGTEQDTFIVEDTINWESACNMCARKDSGARCFFLCCGYIACHQCVVQFYKHISALRVCLKCDSVFPEQLSLGDIIVAPTANCIHMTNMQLERLAKQTRRKNGQLMVFFLFPNFHLLTNILVIVFCQQE